MSTYLPGVVGIDISKKVLDVNAEFRIKRHRFSNDTQGITALVDEIHCKGVSLVVFEATGGYERELASHLHEAGIKLHLANPYQVREFAKGMGFFAKTDKIDAKVLVEYGIKKCPEPTPPRDPEVIGIDELRTRQQQLTDMLTAEKNRLRLAPPSVQDDIKDHLRWLGDKIKALDDQIAKKIKCSPALSQKASILRSVPGIGPGTTAALIAGLPELGERGHKKLNALVGVAPFAKDSGQSHGKRYIRGGRASVRCALFMAILSTVRLVPKFKEFYLHLLKAGKPKKVALTACIRKLVGVLNTLIKREQLWCSE